MNERIKLIRKNAKESQEEFGKTLGLSRNFVWMLESGEREASDRTIRDICREYYINEEWLRTGEGEMMRPMTREAEIAKIADQMLNDVEPSIRTALYKVISDMNEEQLEALLGCARALVDAMK